MARLDKDLDSFANCQHTYPYGKLKRLIKKLGYNELPTGKTGGSRRKFFNKELNDMIVLHEPHDGEVARGMVRRIQKQLSDKGLI